MQSAAPSFAWFHQRQTVRKMSCPLRVFPRRLPHRDNLKNYVGLQISSGLVGRSNCAVPRLDIADLPIFRHERGAQSGHPTLR